MNLFKKKPLVITLGNQKGGVGKTTTVINVADAVGKNGYKVLVVDADPQANTTSILLPEISLRDRVSLAKALINLQEGETLTDYACQTDVNNVDVVPNSIRCTTWERSVAKTTDSVLGIMKLIKHDQKLLKYDFMLIDTPPNIGTMVNNALIISDYVLIPIPVSDQFALDGLATYLKLVLSFRNQNKNLKLLGVVLTRFSEDSSLFNKNREKIVGYFSSKGINVFDTAICHSIDFDKAHMKRQTIFQFNPSSFSSINYMNLCKEIIEVINYDQKYR